MSTVSKETMDYISDLKNAAKAKVAPKAKPVAAFPAAKDLPGWDDPKWSAQKSPKLFKPCGLMRFLARAMFVGSIFMWFIISLGFDVAAPGSSTINIGLLSDRELLVLADTAVFLASGLALATYKVMDTINAAVSVLSERMNAK